MLEPAVSSLEERLVRKSLIFISAALTTFVMAVLGGAAHAYTSLKVSAPPAPQTAHFDSRQVPMAPALQAQSVSPQDAAAIAARYLGRTDLYSVELADFNGAQTYKVSFTAGHIVYVSLTGQVLAAQAPQPAVIVSAPPSQGHAAGGEPHGGGGEDAGGDD